MAKTFKEVFVTSAFVVCDNCLSSTSSSEENNQNVDISNESKYTINKYIMIFLYFHF